MKKIQVQVKRLKKSSQLPKYMSEGASGCDVCACMERSVLIEAGQRVSIPTGFSVAIPSGFEIQVRPRSGLAWKQGLTVVNTPGTIDSDYRGEICVLLINLGENPVEVRPGDRIAQLVLQEVPRAVFEEVEVLQETLRGDGGFGSTGVSEHT